MRRILVSLAVGLLAGTLALPVTTRAASPSGTVAPPPNHRDDTATLQRALQACVPGGTDCVVHLRAGTYLTRQLFANGFHGSIVGAGMGATVVQALAGYKVPSVDPYAHAPGARNPYPVMLSFGAGSSVGVSGLTLRVSGSQPVPAGWRADAGAAKATWLDAAVYVQGSGTFSGVAIVGASGGDIPGGEGTTGVNLDKAVLLRSSSAASVFTMTRSRVIDTGNGFELDGFAGRATIGGSAADANSFTRSPGGYFHDLDGATVQESWNRIQVGPAANNWQGILIASDTSPAPSHVVIEHNQIVEDAYDFNGVAVTYTGPGTQPPLDVAVSDNLMSVDPGLVGWADGILAVNTNGLVISGNTIALQGVVSADGIDLQGASGTVVVHNTISGIAGGPSPTGGAQGAISGWGIGVYPPPGQSSVVPTGTVIADNTITGVAGAAGAGIHDVGSQGTVIAGNAITQVAGGDGIDVERTTGTTVSGNSVSGSGGAAVALWSNLAGGPTSNATLVANDVSAFTPAAFALLTATAAQLYVDAGSSHVGVVCESTGDVVLDLGTADTLTGCRGLGAAFATAVSQVGYDISWPQCGQAYPTDAAFRIVGVNGGLAFAPNPCVGSELAWAGPTGAQLYANTGNPGPQLSSHWPTGQTTPQPCDAANPDTAACAYDYGYNAAADSFQAAVTAYAALGQPASAAAAVTWWLDVETTNSWRSNVSLNVANLQGAVDYLTTVAKVASVGFYSSAGQWQQITGGATAFAAYPSWVAGAPNERGAALDCAGPGFTGGGVALAQFPLGGFDADLRCPVPAGSTTALP